MTTRYMLDTVASQNTGHVPSLPRQVKVPGGAEVTIALEAGYVNGSYAWKSRFPDVWIDVNGSDPLANVVDCENGDITPAQAPGWAAAHNATKNHEFPAVIYCNRSNLTAVFNAMNAAGLKVARDFYLWIATLDGTERVPDMTGVVAVQAFGSAQLGFNADLSVVYDDAFPRGGSKPPPAQGPYGHSAPNPGGYSLWHVAGQRGYTDEDSGVTAIRDVSADYLSPENLAFLDAYIAMGRKANAAGHPWPVMPDGLRWATKNP